mgnify:CR=1 FL=1
MKKVYTVFKITKNGKIKDLRFNRYDTEQECYDNDLKNMNCGEWLILAVYVHID